MQYYIQWRQGFVFDWNPFSGIDKLELKVFDKDLGSEDDFIGRYINIDWSKHILEIKTGIEWEKCL